MEFPTTLGVWKLFDLINLEFTALLDNRDDDHIAVVVLSTVNNSGLECLLSRLRVRIQDAAIILRRGTNMEDNFPRCFDHLMNIDLEVVDISL